VRNPDNSNCKTSPVIPPINPAPLNLSCTPAHIFLTKHLLVSYLSWFSSWFSTPNHCYPLIVMHNNKIFEIWVYFGRVTGTYPALTKGEVGYLSDHIKHSHNYHHTGITMRLKYFFHTCQGKFQPNEDSLVCRSLLQIQVQHTVIMLHKQYTLLYTQ
jgi:hypothetical protein